MPTTVRVLLFATAREAVGRASLDVPVPAGGIPARTVLEELVGRHPALGAVLRTSRLVVNGRVARGAPGRLRPGDELAVHPPYSGG